MVEFKQNKNCLNLIRIIAALNVFYGHAMTHLNVKIPTVISKVIGIFQGVPIFFILSGFLIWMSIERTPTFASYCKKRILRLYPELVGGGITQYHNSNYFCME